MQRKHKLILTRPKEPEFVTAQRVRPTRVKSSAEQEEEMMAKIPKFKARPLNKKVPHVRHLFTPFAIFNCIFWSYLPILSWIFCNRYWKFQLYQLYRRVYLNFQNLRYHIDCQSHNFQRKFDINFVSYFCRNFICKLWHEQIKMRKHQQLHR